MADPTDSPSLWNAPNLLCLIRLLGSPWLVVCAIYDRPTIFLGLLFVLFLTDWLDGKLAIWLRQQTKFGARLDSFADAAMWCGLVVGTWWLQSDVIWSERYWLIATLLSYLLTTGVGLWKFRRVPSYHTWAAKSSWMLIAFSVLVVFAVGVLWPLRVALVAVMVTNLEATAITCVLPSCRADVRSLWHALQVPTLDAAAPDAHETQSDK